MPPATSKETRMRYMTVMIPNVSPDEWTEGPSAETATAMNRYNEELTRAGVLLAGLARLVRERGLAEEVVQDARVLALEQRPPAGGRDSAGAWRMASAKHRGSDRLRRRAVLERKHEQIARELEVDERRAASA